ncbi:polyamine ABC transporter, ATP-binding protein [Peptoniphilus sp. oral taxon 375 str. F0436]|uniref:ABC transporter ATP-binding protein n=1 Tax=Urinicoccus timonensis TaxID=2024205 RepID=UPI00021A2097|nr:ABC transporter ATP-binding protein [Urinicoccus timonensis]EGS31694.1 polyamine ABC transporter, ATP-binding protein [Peptoniphilus sp. oral taxon 375 str. F0436]
MNYLHIQDISKTFEDKKVLDHIDLQVEKDEFLTLLGPSGCGKTTLLRILGGFERADSGKILFEGRDISQQAPYQRPMNTVFQQYALFPHLNVYHNIAFGLKLKKLPAKLIKEKVSKILELVNLVGYENRTIQSLSGGQQQRVSIARALVNEPKVLLLDEPLAALDLNLRKKMQLELKTMQQQVGITFIYVTHDQEEALTMSDQIVVLNEGKIQQVGSPVEIYNEPKNSFVAKFVGQSNILKATMKRDFLVTIKDIDLDCVDKGFAENEKVQVVIRPEDVEISKTKGQFQGRVLSTVFKGIHYEMVLDIMGKHWLSQSTRPWQEGEEIRVYIDPDNIHVMKEEDHA